MNSIPLTRRHRWLTALVLHAIPTGLATADVLVVDPASSDPTTFDTIHSAISAAQPGDTIVIRAGEYDESIQITKGVTVTADTNALVRARAISILQVPSGQSAVLRGLDFGGGVLGHGVIGVGNCLGLVFIEDCTFTSAIQVGSGGSVVRDSNNVVLSRCWFDSPTFGSSSFPFATLTLENSSTRLFDVTSTGKSSGAVHTEFYEKIGYPAVTVRGGRAAFEGGTYRGGAGGDWYFLGGCEQMGDGGPGMLLEDGAVVSLADVELIGGPTGDSLGHACPPALPGQPLEIEPGSFATSYSGNARILSANSPVRTGDSVTMTVSGEGGASGDLLWMMVSTGQNPLPATPALKPFSTYLALASPTIVFLGTPATTTPFGFTVTVPSLPSGIDAAKFALQALWFDASDSISLPTAPTMVTIVE